MLQVLQDVRCVVDEVERREAVVRRATEYLVDVAYEDWLEAVARCADAWGAWCARRTAAGASHAVYAAALDREAAAAAILDRACAIAEARRG